MLVYADGVAVAHDEMLVRYWHYYFVECFLVAAPREWHVGCDGRKQIGLDLLRLGELDDCGVGQDECLVIIHVELLVVALVALLHHSSQTALFIILLIIHPNMMRLPYSPVDPAC